jgi:ribosomal protein L37AE/L43A
MEKVIKGGEKVSDILKIKISSEPICQKCNKKATTRYLENGIWVCGECSEYLNYGSLD